MSQRHPSAPSMGRSVAVGSAARISTLVAGKPERLRKHILISMQKATTIRVSTRTRNDIRELADSEGLTMGEQLDRMVRAERQRRIGEALAAVPPDADDDRWVDIGVESIGDDAGG